MKLPIAILNNLEEDLNALPVTHDSLREAERNNLLMPVVALRSCIEDGEDNIPDFFSTCTEIRRRIDLLKVEPEFAGNHEIHRVTKRP